MVLKATANDRLHLGFYHDEFRGHRSGLCRSDASDNGAVNDKTGYRSGNKSSFLDESQFYLKMDVFLFGSEHTGLARIRYHHTCFTPGVMIWATHGYMTRIPCIQCRWQASLDISDLDMPFFKTLKTIWNSSPLSVTAFCR
ncbi:hypothetical protein TNCV_3906781 [Trichonephila clavipes]|nr:hypothetical protein TNCV_3906781 [Trichonephila clavipes]